MWRHVRSIFNQVGVRNVLWVWSPNVQSYKHRGLPSLRATYPGDRYVDMVGVDGYIYDNPTENFHQRFQPTFDQLRAFVPDTPWIVAECGVGDAASKPRQLRNLVRAVARRKRLTGLNYFNNNKSTSAANWLLDDTPASLDAFRRAINSPVFGAAKPG
jgi:beta-mannanase